MIDVLSRTVRNPAEFLMLALAVLGLMVGAALLWRTSRRGPPRLWAWLVIPTAIVALGALSAPVREASVVQGISAIRGTVLSGHVASEHAAAAAGLWWSFTLAGALCGLSAVGLVRASARGATRAGVGMLVGALALGLVGALLSVPGVVWCAMVLGACALAGSLPTEGETGRRSLGLAVVGAWLAICGSVVAAEAELARALALIDLRHDLARMPSMWMAWWAVAAAAVLAAAGTLPALRRAWTWGHAVVGIALVGALVTWQIQASRARAWGPAAELQGLAAGEGRGAPVYLPAEGWRWTGGCLWIHGGAGYSPRDWGTASERHLQPPCPGTASPRIADRPTLLLPGDAQLALLGELDGPGELRLLVRLDADPGPGSLEPWRWATETVQVMSPTDARWRPLPGAAVVVAGHGLPPIPPQPRVDLVVLPTPERTVADFLRLCAEAWSTGVLGLRCIVGLGTAEEWRAWTEASGGG